MAGVSAITTMTWTSPAGATGSFTLQQGVVASVPVGSQLQFQLITQTGVTFWSVAFWSDNFTLNNALLQGLGKQTLSITIPVAPSLATIEIQAVGESGGRDVQTCQLTTQLVGPKSQYQIVRVRHTALANAVASPYNANVFDTVVCDTSVGDVVINLPPLTGGQWVTVHQDGYTSLSAANVNINGPAGVNIAQPAPNNANMFVPQVQWTTSSYQESDLTWFNGGSPGGYSVR